MKPRSPGATERLEQRLEASWLPLAFGLWVLALGQAEKQRKSLAKEASGAPPDCPAAISRRPGADEQKKISLESGRINVSQDNDLC